MREENEAPPSVILFQDDDDPNARAVYALGHIFRWVLDGSGVEARTDGRNQRNQSIPRKVITERFLALVEVVRPELLRHQVLRPLAASAGCCHVKLCRYAREAEEAFGYIAPRRGRATRPPVNHTSDLREADLHEYAGERESG